MAFYIGDRVQRKKRRQFGTVRDVDGDDVYVELSCKFP